MNTTNGAKATEAGAPSTPVRLNEEAYASLCPPVRLPHTVLSGHKKKAIYHSMHIPSKIDPDLRDRLTNFEERMAAYPGRTFIVNWTYETRVLPASQELESTANLAQTQLEARGAKVHLELTQIADEKKAIQERLKALESEVSTKNAAFAKARAEAHLPWSDDNGVSVQMVEAALFAAVPSMDELAGEHRMIPPPAPSPWYEKWVSVFLGVVAQLACGFFIGFCLGGLVDFVSKTDLQRGNGLPRLLMVATLGTVIVGSIGSLVSKAISSLARCLEVRPKVDEGNPPQPALREGGVAAGWLMLAILLLIAEVTAEAFGVRQMHLAALDDNKRLNIDAGSVWPFYVYFIIATVFSAAFICHKGVTTWNTAAQRQREVWLLSLQGKWIQVKRAEAEVQNAFIAAAAVRDLIVEMGRCTAKLGTLEEKERALDAQIVLDAGTQERLDEANSRAVGERSTLDNLIIKLVEMAEGRRAKGGTGETPVFRPYFGPGTDIDKEV